MLFKQWNEISLPRHELDYPILSPQEETLQPMPLPTVTITPTDMNFGEFDRIILTTKVMKSLFPKNLLDLANVGTLEASLSFEVASSTDVDHIFSHDVELYGADFVMDTKTNTAMPGPDNNSSKRAYSFSFPIFSIPSINSLLVIIDENFLKFSPIFDNVLARELASRIKAMPQITLLGASDQICKFRCLTSGDCSLNPPEFITGFVGSLMYELITNNVENFETILVPSEGPVGFEKLMISDIQQLVAIFANRLAGAVDPKVYSEECYKHWKVEGAASSTQSGLYI